MNDLRILTTALLILIKIGTIDDTIVNMLLKNELIDTIIVQL